MPTIAGSFPKSRRPKNKPQTQADPPAIITGTDTPRSVFLALKVYRFAGLVILGSRGICFQEYNAEKYECEGE